MIVEVLIAIVVVAVLILVLVMLGLAACGASDDRQAERALAERRAQHDLYSTTGRNVVALPNRRGIDDGS